MSANGKRNTQIPEDAILGAADKYDKFEIDCCGEALCCEPNVIPTKSNTTMKDTGKAGRVITSIDLVPGMAISAENGGKNTTKRVIAEGPQI